MKSVKRRYRSIRMIALLWALAIGLLIEMPSVFVIGCESRLQSMEEVNRIGILAVVRFSLGSLFCAGLGFILYLKTVDCKLRINSQVNEIFTKLQKRRLSKLIGTILLVCFPLLGSAEPIINLFVVKNQDPELIQTYYIWLFLVVGFSLTGICYGIIRFLLSGKIAVEIDDTIPEAPIKSYKRKLAWSGVLCVAAGILIVGMMRHGTWLLQPYVSTIPAVAHKYHEITYDQSNGVYTIQADEDDFKILQLTDIHLGGSIVSAGKDRMALEAVYALIENEHPDFVVITGDLVFPLGIMSFSLNNYIPMIQFASFMRNIGVPWAVTFGNHDTENVATHGEEDISQVFQQFGFEKTRSLLYPKYQPAITGRSNQMIVLQNPDKSIRQALFLIDSNDYQSKTVNDYDYIHEDQVQWYKDSLLALEKENGEMPKSLLFYHIPVQEYKTAYELYKTGSSLVTYHYGKIGESGEAICVSDTPSTLFEEAVALGSTQGMFVGHDHYNNISMTYRGIRLTYGMSIDYLAMPGIASQTQQRGGTRIVIHPDGSFDCKQIPLTTCN